MMIEIKHLKVALLFLLFASFYYFVPAIGQDPSYHNFADQLTICSTPHALNVWSNAIYLIVGWFGYFNLSWYQKSSLIHIQKWIAVSLILIGLGSGYYHLNPSNASLLWDRLAMSICFGLVISLLIQALSHQQKGDDFQYLHKTPVNLAIILVCLFSVLYWFFSEYFGYGDLRLYALVQFGGIMFIVVNLFRLKGYPRTAFAVLMIGYILAKLCEHFDTEIYVMLDQTISGHSLKHIVSGLAVLPLLIPNLFDNYNQSQ